MKIVDVVVVGGPLVVASAAEVNALESRLWIKFPSGYRDYMERLGEGVLGGTFVRIYPPWKIEKDLVNWRRRINELWFWYDTLELLPKERAVECVILGETSRGDELIFHPCRSDRLFVLPTNCHRAFAAGNDLLEAIEWMCSSGQLTKPFTKRHFQPFDSRVEEAGAESAEFWDDPIGQSLCDIIELAESWVARHSAREINWDKVDLPAGKREFMSEAINLTADPFDGAGYEAKYSITDNQSGSRRGVLRITRTDNTMGYSYTPESGSRIKSNQIKYQAPKRPKESRGQK